MPLIHWKHCRTTIILFVLLTGTNAAHAQRYNPQFRLGAVVGFNISQMDGDNFTGYDKIGLKLGVKSWMPLNKQLALSLELLYTQKGSTFEPRVVTNENRPTTGNRTISLQFAEVPLIAEYKFRGSQWYIEGGLAAAVLVDQSLKNEFNEPTTLAFDLISDDFESLELNAVLGFGSYFNDQIFWNFRTTIGLSRIYDITESEISNENELVYYDALPIQQLRNYLVSLTVGYRLN